MNQSVIFRWAQTELLKPAEQSQALVTEKSDSVSAMPDLSKETTRY